MQQSEYSYLSPPQQASNIVHEPTYIFKTVGDKRYRKIFNDVQLDPYELDRIKELEFEIQKRSIPLPQDWTQIDSLKLCYNGKFKLKDTIEKLLIHLQWRATLPINPNPQIMDFITQGIIYTFGRDFQFRPVIHLNAHKIDGKKHSKEFMIFVLSYFFQFVRQHMFLPGKVENWIIIIQTDNVGLFGLPTSGLGEVIKNMALNFVGCLHRMYVLNPSTSLNLLWKAGTPFMDDEAKSKNVFLSTSNYGKLKEVIPEDQLEKKYGGRQQNLTKFWPPQMPQQIQ